MSPKPKSVVLIDIEQNSTTKFESMIEAAKFVNLKSRTTIEKHTKKNHNAKEFKK